MTSDNGPAPRTYLLLLFNTHQPYVRHPEADHCLEENWLNEAITESYIPLLDRIEGIARDGIRAPLSFVLSPTLLLMLDDNLRRQRYLTYLDERLGFLETEIHRFRGQPDLCRIAHLHRRRIERCRTLFTEMWHGDLLGVFRRLRRAGAITLLPSVGTHAYLPLWNLFPEIVELQVRAGLMWHEHCFGEKPEGFWLPECGYYPGLDVVLARNGVRHCFVDAHGVLNGRPGPVRGTDAPVHTPAGIAVLPRDLTAHRQVWVESEGYPGDPIYLNRWRDASFECDRPTAPPIAHELNRYPCGVRYWSGRESARPYSPEAAYARCVEHARHFVSTLGASRTPADRSDDRPPLIAGLYDTEHFGHWWFEGPMWLDHTLRLLAGGETQVQLVSAREYLAAYPVNQVVQPTTSSWGYQGYSEVWLMGRNHWIYPPLFDGLEWLRRLVGSGAVANARLRAILNRYLRESMLAQASDWAFMMHSEPKQTYAATRIEGHFRNMQKLRAAVDSNSAADALVEHLDRQMPLFSGMDLLAEYRGCLETSLRSNELGIAR